MAYWTINQELHDIDSNIVAQSLLNMTTIQTFVGKQQNKTKQTNCLTHTH
jgi:hypothetical protein